MSAPGADAPWLEAFRQGLRDLGYIEGQNLALEVRHANNDTARAVQLASDLRKRSIDVMVAYAVAVLPTLKTTMADVPIVMTVHVDPVGSGVAESLARPGGNITGLMDGHVDLVPKRVELLRELLPSASRIGVVFNETVPHAARGWKLAQTAAPTLGVTVAPIQVGGPGDIERAFDAARKARVDGLVLVPDATWSIGQERRLADLSIKHRVPTIGTVREFAQRGLLVAYGTNFIQLWRKSATYVDRILKGARPADLPIEYPTTFDLVINLKTAKALGIAVPQSFLLRAQDVIQ